MKKITKMLSGNLPLSLRKLVVGLVFVVGVKVEDTLDEVLAEHFWIFLQQQMEQAVFTQTETEGGRHFGLITLPFFNTK